MGINNKRKDSKLDNKNNLADKIDMDKLNKEIDELDEINGKEKVSIKIGLGELIAIIMIVILIALVGVVFITNNSKKEEMNVNSSKSNSSLTYNEINNSENNDNKVCQDDNSDKIENSNNSYRYIDETKLIMTKAKPIIYIYPTTTTEVEVKVGNPERLTCTYPKYNEEKGWKVIAKPNGELEDKETGRKLYALYWEGQNIKDYTKENDKIKEGFCIEGKDTAQFLEEKLKILGLNEREAEEFIVYWLPQMEKNKYNYIRFQSMEEINENMPLEITPNPETLIRVVMEWKGLDEKIETKEQQLQEVERKGYTVVEWGGTII